MTNPLKVLLSIVFLTVVLSFNTKSIYKQNVCEKQFKVTYWKDKLQVSKLQPLNEKQKILFLAYFNNEPPITDKNPKYVMVYMHPHFNRSFVLFKEDGPCIDSVHMIPTDVIRKWLESKGT